MNSVVLLAGGTGSRSGSDIPKQYIRFSGSCMLTMAAKPLFESDHTDTVVIVAQKEWRSLIEDDLERIGSYDTKMKGFADPGKNRQLSIKNALDMIVSLSGRDIEAASDDDTVFIHDAARPFLSSEQIDSCYEALGGHDGVMPVLPVKDTVYMSGDGRSIGKLLDRSKIYSGQAPELFVLKKYYRANTALSEEEILRINGSAEPAVLAGMDVVMIPGDEKNFKVTTDEDLKKCRMILEKRG